MIILGWRRPDEIRSGRECGNPSANPCITPHVFIVGPDCSVPRTKRAYKRLGAMRCRFAMRYTRPHNVAPLKGRDRDPGAARRDKLANNRSLLAPRRWFDTQHASEESLTTRQPLPHS